MTASLSLTVAREMSLPAEALYRAWTTGWGEWLAEAGSVRATAEAGAPFFFELAERHDDGRPVVMHPHYGRFLQLEPGALVSLTWVTGASGTAGAETVLTVRLDPMPSGTKVTLTHEGFLTAQARDAHANAWPNVLEHQERALASRAGAAGAGTGTARADSARADSARADSARADSARAAARVALPDNRSIPEATVIPVRSYPDLDAAVAWMRDALGCRERLRIPGHRVQLTVGNGAVVAVAWDPATAPSAGRPPATLMLRVSDADATYALALQLGATGVAEPTDFPYGERQAVLRDPFGHSWTLTQTIADVDPASWGGELVGEGNR